MLSHAKPLIFSMFVIIIFGINGCRGLTHNQAQTGPNHTDPSLRTRTYAIAYDVFFERLLGVIQELPRWEILSQNKASGKIVATRKSRLFRFVDDVHIQVIKKGAQEITIDLHSASRIGKGDFGQNARNIRELFDQLDQNILKESLVKSGLNQRFLN